MANRKKIIEVSADETALLLEAERIEKEADAQREQRERAASKEYGRTMVDPFLTFTPDEVEVIRARDNLKAAYQERFTLPYPPILIPAASPYYHNTEDLGIHFDLPKLHHQIYRGRDRQPMPEDLKDTFLRCVPTFRDGERLYLWNKNHYQFLPDNEVKARIKTVLNSDFYIQNPTTLLTNILALLKVEERILGKPDSIPNLVAVQNGEVNLETMELMPSSPSHFLTHYLDVPWKGWQPCPVFSAFLNHIAGGDHELIQRVLEVVGFLLVSDNRAKRFTVFQGEGDCGKSVLGNLISSFYERRDCAALADFQFGEKFSMASIANAHFCLCMDLSSGTIDSKAVSMLKQITGGDLISIEAKGKDAFTDYISCKVLFGTNHPIKLKSRDPAFARRLLLIPFQHPVADKDKDRDLLNKLKFERSGILYQALCAYRDVVQRGYIFTGEDRFGFTADHIVVEAPLPNSMEHFTANCCILDQQSFTPTESLHRAFLTFCECRALPIISDRAAFSRALNNHLKGQLSADKQRVNGVPTNGYRGIRLREEVENNV